MMIIIIRKVSEANVRPQPGGDGYQASDDQTWELNLISNRFESVLSQPLPPTQSDPTLYLPRPAMSPHCSHLSSKHLTLPLPLPSPEVGVLPVVAIRACTAFSVGLHILRRDVF